MNKLYVTKTVYYEDGTKFIVLNNKTKTIQSVWLKYYDAVNTARDLNKFMSKKTQLTNNVIELYTKNRKEV